MFFWCTFPSIKKCVFGWKEFHYNSHNLFYIDGWQITCASFKSLAEFVNLQYT